MSPRNKHLAWWRLVRTWFWRIGLYPIEYSGRLCIITLSLKCPLILIRSCHTLRPWFVNVNHNWRIYNRFGRLYGCYQVVHGSRPAHWGIQLIKAWRDVIWINDGHLKSILAEVWRTKISARGIPSPRKSELVRKCLSENAYEFWHPFFLAWDDRIQSIIKPFFTSNTTRDTKEISSLFSAYLLTWLSWSD